MIKIQRSLVFIKLLFVLFLLLVFTSLFNTVLAQTPEEIAQKYQVSFPISELGNCGSFSECRTFCEDPVNTVACVSFAKSKGFYKEDPVVTRKDQVLARAKEALGCNSFAECKAYCEIPANIGKCSSFARQNNLQGGATTPIQPEQLLQKAKDDLGCDSASSCASFCSQEANRNKCTEFAKQTGIRGGEQNRGPGGCTSAETCKLYCSDPVNYNECSHFSPSQEGFKGPGGCNSEQSCRTYCEQNPAACRMISVDPIGGPGVIENPQKAAEEFKNFCNQNQGSCSNNSGNFFSNKEARLEFEKFCSANPEKCGAKAHYKQSDADRRVEYGRLCKENPQNCGVGPGGYLIPGWKEGSQQGSYVQPEDFCKRYPDRCPNEDKYQFRFENTNFDPQQMCTKTPNCRWDSGSCQCTGFGSGSQPSGGFRDCPPPAAGCGNQKWWDGMTCSCRESFNYQSSGSTYPNSMNPGYGAPNATNRSQQEATCKAGGGSCNWNGDICNCQGYQSPTNYSSPTTQSPAEQACRSAGGSWNGSQCQMPGGSTVNYSGGMSRESQEAGCRACNGSCNWSGDFCNCQCGSTGTSTTPDSSAPPPPQPTSQTSTEAQPTPVPAVQGVSTATEGFLQKALNFVFRR